MLLKFENAQEMPQKNTSRHADVERIDRAAAACRRDSVDTAGNATKVGAGFGHAKAQSGTLRSQYEQRGVAE